MTTICDNTVDPFTQKRKRLVCESEGISSRFMRQAKMLSDDAFRLSSLEANKEQFRSKLQDLWQMLDALDQVADDLKEIADEQEIVRKQALEERRKSKKLF